MGCGCGFPYPGTQACACMWKAENHLRCPSSGFSSLLFFLRQGLSLRPCLLVRLVWLAWASPCLCFPSVLFTKGMPPRPGGYLGAGKQPKSTCLPGKLFTTPSQPTPRHSLLSKRVVLKRLETPRNSADSSHLVFSQFPPSVSSTQASKCVNGASEWLPHWGSPTESTSVFTHTVWETKLLRSSTKQAGSGSHQHHQDLKCVLLCKKQ